MASQTAWTYGQIEEAEAPMLGRLLSQALHFNMTDEGAQEWITRVGMESLRVARENSAIAAGLRIIDMAQWFGGKKVPVVGISAVGCAPEYRGQGATSFRLQNMHREFAAQRCPLSVLFPATLTFYRHSGYERAGVWNTYELATSDIHVKARDLDVVPVLEDDFSEIHRVYAERARLTNGNLERTALLWKRALESKEKICHRYLFQRNGATEGYVAYIQGGQFEPIRITDYGVLSRDAGLRLLTFFADHRSLATSLTWNGGPADPLLYLLDEQKQHVKTPLEWVVRILDVENAMALRGYPVGLNGALHLDVQDRQLENNDGRFVVEWKNGEVNVWRGGEGRLQTDIRTLASLYTGHLTARELQIVGQLQGPEEVALAQMAFSGPRPWMSDIF